jgi:hypothetical protein
MITKAQAMAAHSNQEFHHTGRHECTRTVGSRGGITEDIVKVRVSGQCQTWKTRPDEFRLPVKYGLYKSAAIDHTNAHEWHTLADCPLRQQERCTVPHAHVSSAYDCANKYHNH